MTSFLPGCRKQPNTALPFRWDCSAGDGKNTRPRRYTPGPWPVNGLTVVHHEQPRTHWRPRPGDPSGSGQQQAQLFMTIFIMLLILVALAHLSRGKLKKCQEFGSVMQELRQSIVTKRTPLHPTAVQASVTISGL